MRITFSHSVITLSLFWSNERKLSFKLNALSSANQLRAQWHFISALIHYTRDLFYDDRDAQSTIKQYPSSFLYNKDLLKIH